MNFATTTSSGIENKMLAYRGKKPAETLERMLYCCPNCQSFESLKSKNDTLKCDSCGYEVRYDPYGFFAASEIKPCIMTIRMIGDYTVRRALKAYITVKKVRCDIIETHGTSSPRKNKGSAFRTFDKGIIEIYKDRMEFSGKRHTIIFVLDRITGLNSTKKNMLDFYYEMSSTVLIRKISRFRDSFWKVVIKS